MGNTYHINVLYVCVHAHALYGGTFNGGTYPGGLMFVTWFKPGVLGSSCWQAKMKDSELFLPVDCDISGPLEASQRWGGCTARSEQ